MATIVMIVIIVIIVIIVFNIIIKTQACESVIECQLRKVSGGDIVFMGENSILHYAGYLHLILLVYQMGKRHKYTGESKY